jgi:alanyl-tRNA synthetase
MGFERITAVLQGKDSNYDTDVFQPIMEAIGQLTGRTYGGKLDDMIDTAFRVIADHLRMLTFAITDGALPGNKGRGSVLRSVLRRAVRFGWQCFDKREPFFYHLVPVLVEHMGGAFPELKLKPERVADIIRGEEAEFLKTLGRGIQRFWQSVGDQVEPLLAEKRGASDACAHVRSYPGEQFKLLIDLQGQEGQEGDVLEEVEIPTEAKEFITFCAKEGIPDLQISGDNCGLLLTTYGFPFDLTRQMAHEINAEVDEDGFDAFMRDHEQKSRAGLRPPAPIIAQQSDFPFGALQEGRVITGRQVAPPNSDKGAMPTTDDHPKWSRSEGEGVVLGWNANNQFIRSGLLSKAQSAGMILDTTCFYAESGGQVGDRGTIKTATGQFQVDQTIKLGAAILHQGQVTEGHIESGQEAKLTVNTEREFTRKNHTATHLLHWALQKVLGEHVEQAGSKVKPYEFTFDFTHTGPMTAEEKAAVERLVNEKIYQDLSVHWRELPIEEAKKLPGVRHFFGDKYGDIVRVVEIGDGFSREFCGGTHLEHTGQAGFFKITSEEGIAKGVRRLTCVTAREAVATVQKQEAVLANLTDRFRCKPEELPARIDSLQEEIKKLQQQVKKGAAADLQGAADHLLEGAGLVNGAKVIIGEMPAGPDEQMRQQVDRLRQKAGSAVVVIGWADDGKVQLLAAVTEDLVKKGLHAGKLVGQIAKVVGGGGGGKPTMAQAGGKEPAKLGEALQLAKNLAAEQLGK